MAVGKLFTVRPAGSKGLGVFATRTISTGDSIVVEKPLLMIRCANKGDNQSQPDVMDFMIKFSQMSAAKKKKYLSLMPTHGSRDQSDLFTKAMAIYGENSQILDWVKDGQWDTRHGVFVTLSRVNHSCNPNTDTHWERCH